MKDVAYILLKNNTILRKKIKNPGKFNTIKYTIDGKEKKHKYKYDRDRSFILPKLIGRERVMFYEQGNPEPLTAGFTTPSVNHDEINAMLDSELFGRLADSVKDKAPIYSIGMVLGLAGIGAIAVIAIFG